MKKQLDDTTIANELRGASLFFRPRNAAAPAAPAHTTSESSAPPPTPSRTTVPTSDHPPVRAVAPAPSRRTIARCSFELFQDQMDCLRRFALEEKLAGAPGSMSEMVRTALDRYIAERADGTDVSDEANRTHGRTGGP